MPSSRSWNRREFSITQNGYFTILKSDGWFSTVTPPGGFRYLRGQSKGAASLPAPASERRLNSPVGAASEQSTIQLQTIDSSSPRQTLIRPALIILAATALTWLLLLWCTSHP